MRSMDAESIKGDLMMSERCVICGEIIPEGRQVCPMCETGKRPMYLGIIKVKGEEKRRVAGTLQELGNWADNNIRCRGECEVTISKIPE